MRSLRTFGVIAAAGLIATSAMAGNEIQFDVNSVTAVASGPFGTGFTGTITLSDDANSTLSAILINGSDQGIASGQLSDFSGTITLVGGVVTGGSFTLEANGSETYMASIVAGSGTVGTSAGSTGPFTIDGLTFMGAFSGLTGGTDFAGVDVTPWAGGAVRGSFLEFKFGPNASGVDTDADVDIFAVVPVPAPAALAAAGLVGLASTRRRR